MTDNLTSPPCWLWPDYPGDDLLNSWVQARRVVSLQTIPDAALIHVTADTRYRLFVNGHRVSDGPCRGFQDRWHYDSLDIARFLIPGDNVLAILAHNLGIGTHSYVHQGFAGLILWGHLGTLEVKTDSTWRVRRCPEHLRHQTRTTIQMGWQEFVDHQKSDGDWTRAGYDDSHWPPTSYFGARPAGSPPWHELTPRDVPLLREQLLSPTKLLSTAVGPAHAGWRDTKNVVRWLIDHPMDWQPAQNAATASLTPPSDPDQASAWCFDFQRELCATLIVEVENARGGEIIDLLVTEGANGPTPTFHAMYFGARLICRPGSQTFETFAPWGFRFLVAISQNSAGSSMTFRMSARHVEYPLARQGRIDSDRPALPDIYEMCAHTQQLCMLDTYVDCPSREQAMWWGDAHCHFDNSQRLAADDRLFVRGLRLLARQSLPNGLLYAHAPTKAHECVLPDFTLMWIETLWQHYWFSASPAMFIEQRDAVVCALDYFHQQAAPTGLLPYDRRYWLFLDWADTFKDGYSTLYNQQYLRTLHLAADMFTLIGDPFAHEVSRRAAALRLTIETQLWDDATAAPLDGIDWHGQRITARSLHNRVSALRNNLFSAHHQQFLHQHLLPFVRGPKPVGSSPYKTPDPLADRRSLTPYFMQFAFEILAHHGHAADVLACIEAWWGDMLRRDLKTTEEVWDAVPGIDSVCHAWTSHPIQWLSTLLLGVRQTSPGWREIAFAPTIYGNHAAGTVDTPLGPIHAAWQRHPQRVDYQLTLPPGCCAAIALPGYDPQPVTGTWRGSAAIA